MAKARRLPPVHPGEILREELMTPLGLSITGLARDLRVPVTRMRGLVNSRRSITADTALRLARYFAPRVGDLTLRDWSSSLTFTHCRAQLRQSALASSRRRTPWTRECHLLRVRGTARGSAHSSCPPPGDRR